MRIYPLFFWVAAIGCIWWCGISLINGSVSAFYHPMAVLGDRFSAYRANAIAIPVVVSFMMAALWFWLRPLAPILYLLGLVPLGFAFTLTLLPKVESGYEQTYWLGDQKHSIPWVFGPYNGRQQRGGDYFLVRAWGKELTPYYDLPDHRPKDHFILAKSTEFNNGKGGLPPENNCVADGHRFSCEWREGDYVYAMSISANNAPTNPQSLFQSVEELMNSFEVGEE